VTWSTDLSFTGCYVSSVDANSPLLNSLKAGHTLKEIDGRDVTAERFDDICEEIRGAKSITLTTVAMPASAPPDCSVEIWKCGSGLVGVVGCEPGATLRDVLVREGLSPYRSVARLTNCSGRQLCGTCIVEADGDISRKSVDEESTLRENGEGYRLACVSEV